MSRRQRNTLGHMSTEWIEYLTRDRRGSTQADIARAAAVDQTTVSRWVRGEGVAAAHTAIRLARALGDDPLRALVAAGHLTAQEARAKVTHVAPAELTDQQLLDMLRHRLERMREGKDHEDQGATKNRIRAPRSTARSSPRTGASRRSPGAPAG